MSSQLGQWMSTKNIFNSHVTTSKKVGFVAFRKFYSGTIGANKTPNHLPILSWKINYFSFFCTHFYFCILDTVLQSQPTNKCIKTNARKESFKFSWTDRLMKVNFKALLAFHFDFEMFYLKIENKKMWTSIRTSAINKILSMVFSQMKLKKGDFRFLKCISKSYPKKISWGTFAFCGKKSKILPLVV